jgi:hypothetical protein
MLIDTDDLSAFTQIARDFIQLALKDQAQFDRVTAKREADKASAVEAAKLAKEAASATYPAELSEIERLEAECEMLDAKIDTAGIDRTASVDGCGLRTYNPLVALLRLARWRLKQAVDTRDRIAAATGTLFGRSL